MRRSLMNIPNIGFGIALAVLAGIALLSRGISLSVTEAAESQRRAVERIDVLQDLLAVVVDIETGVRGYVITGNAVFLEPYYSGLGRIDPQLNRVHTAFADQPSQQTSLAALDEAETQLRHQSGLVVSLKASQVVGSAEREVASGRGKRIMDRIRQLIADLSAEDRAQLWQHDRHFQSGMRWNMLLIVGGSGFGFSALSLAAVAINRILRERSRLNSELLESVAENTVMLDRLRASGAELTRSNKELEQFAYVASHDLQEPLRKVSSFAQLLASRYSGKLDGDANPFIGYMVDGARRMQTLIQNLLAYSRLGRKGQPFAAADGNGVLKQALSNLEGAIEESGAVATSGPLPTVLADESQLVQLFQNLIGNAIKFRGAETPVIQIQAEGVGPSWSFSVSDNGIGIDQQFAERIFVIFQRLHGRDEYPGTGIGLALCKKIVERHGGRIWLEPRPGRGAVFRFTLPRCAELEQSTHEHV
jgi:signal transduction histidine kinase